ncbi:MAG: hypothetical protein LKE59_06480 [Eubacterium sp.]|nr:hypothetical protein [Eubacterium sp.]
MGNRRGRISVYCTHDVPVGRTDASVRGNVGERGGGKERRRGGGKEKYTAYNTYVFYQKRSGKLVSESNFPTHIFLIRETRVRRAFSRLRINWIVYDFT